MTTRVWVRWIIGAGLVFPLAHGCGGGGGTRPLVDATPPAAVTDISVTAVSDSSVTLQWTAPGDDGQQGTAKTYDVRRSFGEITGENWVSAIAVLGEPSPGMVGTRETFTVSGLQSDTTYHFALKTADEIPNWSELSNGISALTGTGLDVIAPAEVNDLEVVSVTDSSATLTWTATGDDGDQGAASQYDLRFGLSEITDVNWSSATQVEDEPAPGDAGSEESFTVWGLDDSTTYYFALKVTDEMANWSGLSNVAEDVTRDAPDLTAPSQVTDLAVGLAASNSIALTWTAPGDDGDAGTATAYDLRYSTSGITELNWPEAVEVAGEPDPVAGGLPEAFTVTDLDPNTTYCFALKAVDDKGNESALSNSPCAETNTPPVAAFAADPLSGTVETVFQFDASLSSDAEDPLSSLEFHWDWGGDGVYEYSTTGDPMASYQFSGVGIRRVILKVVDTRGLSDRDTVEVEVTEVPDTTAPSAVTDLTVGVVASTSVELLWTAPGDDGGEGTASVYDLRYHTAEITAGTWDGATPAGGVPVPQPSGTPETFALAGLNPNTTYHFALKARDDAGNWSAVSNSVAGTTNTPPVAAFTVDPVSGTTATMFQFDASLSSDAEDPIGNLEFRWDWGGDGVYDYSTAGDPTASYQFSGTGTRDVILEVIDTLGLSDKDTVAVAVTDGIAPAPIDDLAAGTVTFSSVELTWTAPGDDGGQGTASVYDLRYHTAEITAGTWDAATPVGGVPVPQPSGTPESFTVTGLAEATPYYFALKTRDEVPNESDLSNVISRTTELDLPYPEHLVLVPHGSFTMGDGVAYCGRDEHAVTLTRDFSIGRYEVTNEEFLKWLRWAYDNGYVTATSSSVQDNLDGSCEELVDLDDPNCEIQFSGGVFSLRDAGHGTNPDHPVKEVTWYGAAAFCDWLSLQEGVARAYDHSTWECGGGDPYSAAGYRLPTDGEWEFAAQYDDERFYPWGDGEPDCSQANYGGCTEWTAAVGSYPGGPSIGGGLLYDMAGNVWEWCNDWHECDLGADYEIDPTGPAEGFRRVVRGGSWEFFTYYPRNAYRTDAYPQLSHAHIGIRAARTAATR